jgi:MFS transporter, UMF1 family
VLYSPHELNFLLGCTTLTSTAILFAKTVIHMPASSLIILGALAPSAGILGAIVWPMAQRRFNLSNLQSMIILVGMILLVPIYGCLGSLRVFRGDDTHENAVSSGGGYGAMKFGGLTTPGEMYIFTTYFGKMTHTLPFSHLTTH